MRKIAFFISVLVFTFNIFSQGDTLWLDYGTQTAPAPWTQINSTLVIIGNDTVNTVYSGTGTIGTTHESYPVSVADDYFTKSDSVITTIFYDTPPSGNVTVEFYSGAAFQSTWIDYYVNNIYYDSVQILNNHTSTIVQNVPVIGDSLRIAAVHNFGGSAWLNAAVIYPYSATFCDTDTLTATAVITDEYDNDGSGAIDQTVNSGTLNVTHSWSNSAITEDLTGLSAGTYTDTITSDSGCVLIKQYTVDNLTGCDTTTITVTGIKTGDASLGTGAIDVSISGEGTAPYTYLWSNDSTTQDLTGLSAGTYFITVTDDNGCTGTNSWSFISDGGIFHSSNFEDQNITPEVGSASFETGTSGGYQVVSNPDPDSKNSSDYVLKVFTEPGTGGRAEYSVSRMETNEKKYIYTWKRYFPNGFWTDVDRFFLLMNQWKTWPCESGGSGDYAAYDTLICTGAGVFNDMEHFTDGQIDYRSRAYPNCNNDYDQINYGQWEDFVLEVYWTNSDSGYYRIWHNDSLMGYANDFKTLFDEFLEGTCNVYWTTGLYTGWSQTGGMTQDSLIAYLDDVKVYDLDSGYVIADVCPTCEGVPAIPTDSIPYRINVNGNASTTDGFNNYIVSWNGDTSEINMISVYGQNHGIDLYLPSTITAVSNNTLTNECFPSGVITTNIGWSGSTVYSIELKDLDTSNIYTIKILSATSAVGAENGIQIWTTEQNRDTILAYNNLCNTAELTGLQSDVNGDLTINVASVGGNAYINAIEIIEYTSTPTVNHCDSVLFDLSVNITPTYDNTGEINLTVSGENITNPLTYLWSNDSTTEDLTGLLPGIYTITVTDNLNCSTVDSYTVNQLNPCDTTTILLSVDTTNQTSSELGEINLIVSEGTAPYTYLWSNTAITQDILVDSGTYSVTVTDVNGCIGDSSFYIGYYVQYCDTITIVLTGTITNLTDSTLGSINLTVSGNGVSPYTYLWSNDSTTQDLINLTYGTYTVTVTENGGCTAYKIFRISSGVAVQNKNPHTIYLDNSIQLIKL